MNLQSLKQSLASVMPILDANIAAAHQEYMDGALAAGAFGYIRARHDTAMAVIERPDLNTEAAYRACALLAIDLRSGTKDNPAGQGDVDAWWQCYRDAGFTAVHPFFEAPMQPAVSTDQAREVS